ncbi:hypothetical protein [Effusibacillus lacus]|uniref:hypothetical protein n=1 Tax=Effusibacillus lacus TaxID=1348429 RepID=UPI000BB805DA|nr:hypothetical protein [Effusibacillus lacus]TCS75311.1 hypothetical protein EDD64_10862 [Effusibacillus lacus]
MPNRKWILYAIMAQALICCWILFKVFFLPYFIWKLLGTTPLASRISDLSVLVLGTLATLTMGAVGYWHAERYPANRSKVPTALKSMMVIHLPLFLFVGYKFLFNSAWDNYWAVYLSGWLSIVTHPMILVGFFGKWVDPIGTILLCGSYLAGVWMYFDENKDLNMARARNRE